jgi:ParB family chromosome partitioning protein
MDSDGRFFAVWQAIEKPRRRASARTEMWSTPQGKRAGQIQRGNGKTSIVFNEKVVPEFAAFVSSRLGVLFGEFQEQQEEDGAKRS